MIKAIIRKHSFFGLLLLLITSCSPLKRYANTAKPWESQIKEFEKLDKAETFPDDYILYLGSSSIRLWDSIHQDMAPYKSVQRGYGGAHFYDLIHFTDRIVEPHKNSKAIVCFVANDLTGIYDEPSVKVTPRQVKRLFVYFTRQVRDIAPETPIFLIEITPAPSRWNFWEKTSRANGLMQAYCESHENLYFIETSKAFLDENQEPRPELFVEDQLHLNRDGYQLWSQIIKSNLERYLN